MSFVIFRSLFFGSRTYLANVFTQMSHTQQASALLLLQPQNKTAPLAIITNDPTQNINFRDLFDPNPETDLKRILIFGHGNQRNLTIKDASDYQVSLYGTHGYRTEEVEHPIAAYPYPFGTEPKNRQHDYSLRPLEYDLLKDPVIRGLSVFFPPQTASAITQIIGTASNRQRDGDILSLLREIKPVGTLADFSNGVSIDHTTLCTQILMMIITYRFTKGKIIAKNISQNNSPLESFIRDNPHTRALWADNPDLLELIRKLIPVKYNLVIPVTNSGITLHGILNILKETYNPKARNTEVLGLFCRHKEGGDRGVETGDDGFPLSAHYAGLRGTRLQSRNPWATKRALTPLPAQNLIEALHIAKPDKNLNAGEIALITSAVNEWGERELHVLAQNFAQPVAQYIHWFQGYSIAYINMVMNNMHMAYENRVI